MRLALLADRPTRAALTVALIVALLALFAPSLARAQGSEETFRLGPGGSAQITFVAYCTDFGKFFPEQIQGPSGTVTVDSVRAALAYVKGLGIVDDSDKALEANFAIWQLDGQTRAVGGGDLTQEIKDNAKTPPVAPADAVSILDAANDGKVSLSLDSWAPIGDKVQILSASDHFHGRGTLTVMNTSDEVLTLYMPTGTIFPGSETRFQEMGAYSEQIQAIDPRLPTTGASDEIPAVALVLLALTLFGGGYSLRRAK